MWGDEYVDSGGRVSDAGGIPEEKLGVWPLRMKCYRDLLSGSCASGASFSRRRLIFPVVVNLQHALPTV